MYELSFKEEAEEGILRFRKSGNVQALKKLAVLLDELKIHPTYGTGKPERLKGDLLGKWFRRITEKHRLVYEIFEEVVTIEVLQVYGHYGDK